ncbi:MAG TPA: zf-HC2 domain-containing protein [Sedimentisphaerales bacterium]|nr:zf-HC2 domain-containing protein [Sedimentisphaerales bacterium]
MEKTCRIIKEQIAELVTGSLPAEKAAELQRHMNQCPACSKYLHALQIDDKLLGDFADAMQPIVTRIEDSVISRLNDVQPSTSAGASGLLRAIVRQRVWKFAAAAAIIIGLVLVMYRDNSSMDITTPAFGKMIEAIEKMPWLHIVSHDNAKNYQRESWFSYSSKILVTRYGNGKVQYLDYPNSKKYIYQPDTNAVTISYTPNIDRVIYDFPRSIVDNSKKRWKADGTDVKYEVKHERGQYQGIDVDFYYSTSYSTYQGMQYLLSRSKLIVDRHKQVLILSESKYWGPNGELRTDSKAIFDYPEDGPKDIYEVGVPKSAKILDYSPTPELLEVMKAYRSHRDNAPARYIVIVVYVNEQTASETYAIDGLETFYFDGINRRRLEVLRFDPVSQQKFSAQCGDSFNSLLKWQREQEKSEFRIWMDEIIMYDGQYRYTQRRSKSTGYWSHFKKVYVPSDGYRLPMGDLIFWRDTLSELGWPNSLLHSGHDRTSIVENDYSKNNNLVCVEVLYDELSRDNKVTLPAKKRLYYLNPQRDYICERQEIHPQPGLAQNPEDWIDKVGAMWAFSGRFSVGEVVEYGRSDLHQWFPKKILMRFRWENPDQTTEERKKTITVYLNTDPEFPDGIFDPNNLP